MEVMYTQMVFNAMVKNGIILGREFAEIKEDPGLSYRSTNLRDG